MKDTAWRSAAKTLSWRLTGSGATFLVAWFIADNFAIAGTIAIVQLITNTILYFVHERIWNQIEWEQS
jgi:uncharacterized membrane protein